MNRAEKIWREWQDLYAEVKSKLREVLRPTMLFYFVFVVIIVGGLGAWTTLFRLKYGDFFESLGTYSIAVLSAASFDLLFSRDKSNSVSLRVIGFAGLATSTALMIAVMNARELWISEKYLFASVPSCALTLGAWILWILANSDNSNFENNSADNAMGGSAESTLSGSLEGFEV